MPMTIRPASTIVLIGLLATNTIGYVYIFVLYFNRLRWSAKLATSYIGKPKLDEPGAQEG
jgi:hypothetical protein